MIKLISKDNPHIIAFRIKHEMEQEDVDWLVKRVGSRRSRTGNPVLLYVEFEEFGELTLSRMWQHFKCLLGHMTDLLSDVDKIAVITSDESLREKLKLEFALVPSIKLKSFDSGNSSQAVSWLDDNERSLLTQL